MKSLTRSKLIVALGSFWLGIVAFVALAFLLSCITAALGSIVSVFALDPERQSVAKIFFDIISDSWIWIVLTGVVSALISWLVFFLAPKAGVKLSDDGSEVMIAAMLIGAYVGVHVVIGGICVHTWWF